MAKGKRIKKAPTDETKEQKFTRLAVARVNRAIKALRAVGKLASRSYTHTEEQAKKIVETLSVELQNVNTAFASPEGKAVQEFTL